MSGKFLPVVALTISAVLSGCSTSQVYIKDGVDHSKAKQQFDECFKQAQNISSAPSTGGYYGGGGGLIGAIAGGIVVGIASGIVRAKKESEFASNCMKENGYTNIKLKAPDIDAYNATKDPDEKTEILRRINRQFKAGNYVIEKSPVRPEEGDF